MKSKSQTNRNENDSSNAKMAKRKETTSDDGFHEYLMNHYESPEKSDWMSFDDAKKIMETGGRNLSRSEFNSAVEEQHTRPGKSNRKEFPVVEASVKPRQSIEDNSVAIIVDTLIDFLEIKKNQKFPSQVPAIMEMPVINETVREISYGKLGDHHVIAAWVRDGIGYGERGHCREQFLIGIRCAMKGNQRFAAVIPSADLRIGDVAIARQINDVSNPIVPDFFPGRRVVSLVRRGEVKAKLETFEFGRRKIKTSSEMTFQGAVYFDDLIGVFTPAVFAGSTAIMVAARIESNLDNPHELYALDDDQDPDVAAEKLAKAVMKFIEKI